MCRMGCGVRSGGGSNQGEGETKAVGVLTIAEQASLDPFVVLVAKGGQR